MSGKKSWATIAKSGNKSLAEIMVDEQAEKNRSDAETEDLQIAMEASLQQQQDEDDMIARAIALSLQEASGESSGAGSGAADQQQRNAATGLSPTENEEIQRALRLADHAQEAESFRLAVMLQAEEEQLSQPTQHNPVGNVRVMTRQQVYLEQASEAVVGPTRGRGDYAAPDDNGDGFRMNSSRPSTAWTRINRSTIMGPNQEMRTKHDVELNNQANAHRLGLLDTDVGLGNQAFNAFLAKQKKNTNRSREGGGKRGAAATLEARIMSLDGSNGDDTGRRAEPGFVGEEANEVEPIGETNGGNNGNGEEKAVAPETPVS